MRFVAKWFIGMAAIMLAALEPAAGQDALPNVVIVYADDMAYGDLSANDAGAWVETPNLDALAASGIRFSNGYSAAPVCGPSRVGLLTGAYPARLGTWWNPDTLRTRIPAEQPLLPAMMGANGYATAVIGKWNLSSDPAAAADVVKDPMTWGGGYWPNADGSYTGVGSGSGAGGRPSGVWGPVKPGDEYLTDRLTRHAVEFINAQTVDRPFFAYLAYNAPHSPLEAAERFRDRVKHLDSEPKRLYAAMVLAVDEGVGQVRKALAAKGFDKNTIIVFASDNGPAKGGFRGYKPEWPREILGARGSLSGTKGTYREAGIRVPFVVSWPAVIAARQVSAAPVVTVDLYRTLSEIVGAKLPPMSDGQNLLPLFQSPGTRLPERDILWAGRICRRGKCIDSGALRNGDWKLLIEDGGTPELYNLASDVAESNDLAGAQTDRYRAMVDRYRTWKATLPENASGTAGKAAAEDGERKARGGKRRQRRNAAQ